MQHHQGAIHRWRGDKKVCSNMCCFWRHLERFFFPTLRFFREGRGRGGGIGFTRSELWAFISEWKACGWHPEQRGLSARPQQTSVPGLYSKILEQGEGLWWEGGGRGWRGERKRGGGGVGVLRVFFFIRQIFEVFSGGRGVMESHPPGPPHRMGGQELILDLTLPNHTAFFSTLVAICPEQTFTSLSV